MEALWWVWLKSWVNVRFRSLRSGIINGKADEATQKQLYQVRTLILPLLVSLTRNNRLLATVTDSRQPQTDIALIAVNNVET